MRTTGLLLLTTLAACATGLPPGVDPEWRQIQAGRLERLHAPRHPKDAVAALLGQDPTPATSRRERPIDQREPVGMRTFREPLPGWVARTSLGYGSVAFRAKGSQLDDRARAAFLGVGVDSARGTAVHLNTWSSDSDLFAGRRINDGVDAAPADASLRGIDLFPHLRFDEVRRGAFAMPIRLGLFGDWSRLAHQDTAVEREWLSLGPRLVLEPVFRLAGDDSAWLELYGRFATEVGPAWFTEEFRGGDDHDATSRWSVGAGAGLRGHVGRMHAELGYDLHQTMFGPTNTELLGDRGGVDMQKQQLFFGLGLSF